MKYGIDTRCQHLADDNKDEIYGAISYPIYQSATFARDRVGGGSGYDYSRLQNPTREHLEKIVASLEEGIDALAFSTGMAAITALMEIFKPGDHIIIDEDLYSGTASFYHQDDRSNPCTDGQLADPQRDQDAWSPYGQGTGKCTEDCTFSGEAGVCDKGALSGT